MPLCRSEFDAVHGQSSAIGGNSAHACGFGWHLFPPHAPPKQLTFTDFTVFRSGTGRLASCVPHIAAFSPCSFCL